MNKVRVVLTFCVLLSSWVAAQSPQDQTSEHHQSSRLDLGDIANEIMGRADTNSQVLSLNLTNLVILLVLKGLLFGATYWGGGGGYGYGGGYGHSYGGGHRSAARNLEHGSEAFMSETEAMLVASYLMGDASQNFDCLYRVACQEPGKSRKYLDAAKVLLKVSKLFPDIVGIDKKYEALVADLQDAIHFGIKYGSCEQKYSCDARAHTKTESSMST